MKKYGLSEFQSTPPCAGGDIKHFVTATHKDDFNPRPPVRGATILLFFGNTVNCISIHAPLCGGRLCCVSAIYLSTLFQSTPPCAGGDISFAVSTASLSNFNPRPPVRGATIKSLADKLKYRFQSTPPCAGGDSHYALQYPHGRSISIHAPLCGGRHYIDKYRLQHWHFNPRPPVRGATAKLHKY